MKYLKIVANSILSCFTKEIYINCRKNRAIAHAVKEYIKYNHNPNKLKAIDGLIPTYKINNSTYYTKNKYGYIMLSTTKEKIKIVSTFMNSIANLKTFVKHITDTYSKSEIKISCTEEPKTTFSIKQYINDQNLNISKFNCHDGIGVPHYNVQNGKYVLNKNNSIVKVNIDKDSIVVSSLCRPNHLKQFVDNIVKKYCAPDNMSICHTVNGKKWSYPKMRRPRNLNKLKLTKMMSKVMNSVDNFISKESMYIEKGLPYRIGMLLQGETGTGKSTVPELVAHKYSMSIYNLNLMSKDIDGNVLINLITDVPSNSIIVIDEIDKQFSLLGNGLENIKAAIQSAIDGTIRLNHRVLIFIIANSDFLKEEFRKEMLRPGRIDKVFKFTEQVNCTL